jgi:hypothetical protein
VPCSCGARLVSRNGSRVLLYWETRSGTQPSAAQVDYFLELRPATGPPGGAAGAPAVPAQPAASSSGAARVERLAVLRELKLKRSPVRAVQLYCCMHGAAYVTCNRARRVRDPAGPS